METWTRTIMWTMIYELLVGPPSNPNYPACAWVRTLRMTTSWFCAYYAIKFRLLVTYSTVDFNVMIDAHISISDRRCTAATPLLLWIPNMTRIVHYIFGSHRTSTPKTRLTAHLMLLPNLNPCWPLLTDFVLPCWRLLCLLSLGLR